MKKSFFSLLFILIAGGATFQIASPVRAAETKAQKAGRTALIANYKKQDIALVKKDWPWISSMLAPDYQTRGSDGRIYNRAQSIALMQFFMPGGNSIIPLDITKCSTKFLSLSWHGSDAIVKYETTSAAIARKDGRSTRMDQVSLGLDYWSSSAQGWKVRQTVELSGKVWLDGKRVR